LEKESVQICGESYGECGHIKGRPYNGEFCSVILKQIQGVDHIAFVENPHSKAQRVHSTPSGKDFMTLLPEEKCNSEDSGVFSVDDSENQEEVEIDSEPSKSVVPADQIEDKNRPTVDSDIDTIETGE
jgi:hypothetical protein